MYPAAGRNRTIAYEIRFIRSKVDDAKNVVSGSLVLMRQGLWSYAYLELAYGCQKCCILQLSASLIQWDNTL